MSLRKHFRHYGSFWVLCAVVLLFFVGGCLHQAVTAKLPPGALNTFDADSYRVLSDAHAVVQSVRDDAAAGKVTLNDGQKTLINHVIADDNTADHLYKAYHANASGDTTALSQAIQLLIGDLASLSTAFPQTSAVK
jgi:hypothetical protein